MNEKEREMGSDLLEGGAVSGGAIGVCRVATMATGWWKQHEQSHGRKTGTTVLVPSLCFLKMLMNGKADFAGFIF